MHRRNEQPMAINKAIFFFFPVSQRMTVNNWDFGGNQKPTVNKERTLSRTFILIVTSAVNFIIFFKVI